MPASAGKNIFVALLVSAWIETFVCTHNFLHLGVALLVSAWIETTPQYLPDLAFRRRTPRECVD